jgi:hypothetical protein
MAGTPGPVGSIVAAEAWNRVGPAPPGGGTWTQSAAWAEWNRVTGTRAQVQKVYSDTAADIPVDINLGIQVIVCYNPPPSPSAADLASFTTSVNHLHSIGLTSAAKPGYVVLHQEVEDHLTAAQFLSIMRYDPNGTGVGGFHAAANAAHFQLYWDAAGSKHNAWAPYYPGAEFLDGIAADFYMDSWFSAGHTPTYLDTLLNFCDHPANFHSSSPPPSPIPFGLMEIGLTGSSPTGQRTQADFDLYMTYLTQVFGNNPAQTVPGIGAMPAGRLRRGLTNGPVLWYDGANNTVINHVVPLNNNITYGTHAATVAYPALYNALIAAGPAGPSVSTSSLPPGVAGTAYSTQVTASGGTRPYVWTKTGTLPPGMTLTSGTPSATIAGTPTTAGTFSPAFTVTDAASLSSPPVTLPITIGPAGAALTITTTAPPPGVIGTFYSTQLGFSGGTPPVSWAITAGALPAGLSLNGSTGVISGTPS